MPVTSEIFRHALGRFASGVTVVTVSDQHGTQHGLTVSAFCSLSLNPPYILISIDKRSSSIPVIESVKAFGVNILAEEQQSTSNRFASKADDKFDGVEWANGPNGMPLLAGSVVQLECSLVQSVDAGDHVIFIGQVETAELDESKSPLLYYHGQYGNFGP